MRKIRRGITPGPFSESVFFDRTRIYDPEHYRVTKSFLDAPERMLRHLIDDNSVET